MKLQTHIKKEGILKINAHSNCFLSLQMVYGGKVLDKFDRRILNAYLDEYFGDFLFDSFQPFHFYKGKGHENYVIPYAANTKADFMSKFLVSVGNYNAIQ